MGIEGKTELENEKMTMYCIIWLTSQEDKCTVIIEGFWVSKELAVDHARKTKKVGVSFVIAPVKMSPEGNFDVEECGRVLRK